MSNCNTQQAIVGSVKEIRGLEMYATVDLTTTDVKRIVEILIENSNACPSWVNAANAFVNACNRYNVCSAISLHIPLPCGTGFDLDKGRINNMFDIFNDDENAIQSTPHHIVSFIQSKKKEIDE